LRKLADHSKRALKDGASLSTWSRRIQEERRSRQSERSGIITEAGGSAESEAFRRSIACKGEQGGESEDA